MEKNDQVIIFLSINHKDQQFANYILIIYSPAFSISDTVYVNKSHHTGSNSNYVWCIISIAILTSAKTTDVTSSFQSN